MPVFMQKLRPPVGSTVDPKTGQLITPSPTMGVMEFLGQWGQQGGRDQSEMLKSLINPGDDEFGGHFAKQGPAKFKPTQYPGGIPSDFTGADRASMDRLQRQQTGMRNREINKTNLKNAYIRNQRGAIAGGNMEVWADPKTGQTMTRYGAGGKFNTAPPKGWKQLDFNVEGADAQKMFATKPGGVTASSLIHARNPQQAALGTNPISPSSTDISVQAVRNLGDSERGMLHGSSMGAAGGLGGVKPAFTMTSPFNRRNAFPGMGAQR